MNKHEFITSKFPDFDPKWDYRVQTMWLKTVLRLLPLLSDTETSAETDLEILKVVEYEPDKLNDTPSGVDITVETWKRFLALAGKYPRIYADDVLNHAIDALRDVRVAKGLDVNGIAAEWGEQ